MGANRYNLNVLCDYATPEKHTAVELHMELAFPHADIKKVQGWLADDDWDAMASYLESRYPERGQLIYQWMHESRMRSKGENSCMELAA